MRKIQVHKILFLVSFWMIAVLFFEFFEGTVMGFDSHVHVASGEPYSFWSNLLASCGITLIGSILIASFEVLHFNQVLRNKPFGISLLLKTFFYICVIFFFSSIAVALSLSFSMNSSLFSAEVVAAYSAYLSSPYLLLILLYWSLAVILALFILNINDKFGKGVLMNLLMGKYHRPREETKIFMFLDLTSSTTIAELLGARKYSALLREFFLDLDQVINKTGGAVFQFVGDEVVVIWNLIEGLDNANCARLFFLAQDKIIAQKNRYIEKYGICPEFKAGLHYGKVIVTEVGGSKQEIAYHGDPINTAARIRSACGEAQKSFLISHKLLSIIPKIKDSFFIQSAGAFNLKGKNKELELYSIERHAVA